MKYISSVIALLAFNSIAVFGENAAAAAAGRRLGGARYHEDYPYDRNDHEWDSRDVGGQDYDDRNYSHEGKVHPQARKTFHECMDDFCGLRCSKLNCGHLGSGFVFEPEKYLWCSHCDCPSYHCEVCEVCEPCPPPTICDVCEQCDLPVIGECHWSAERHFWWAPTEVYGTSPTNIWNFNDRGTNIYFVNEYQCNQYRATLVN